MSDEGKVAETRLERTEYLEASDLQDGLAPRPRVNFGRYY
jgi:hypothetical protein